MKPVDNDPHSAFVASFKSIDQHDRYMAQIQPLMSLIDSLGLANPQIEGARDTAYTKLLVDLFGGSVSEKIISRGNMGVFRSAVHEAVKRCSATPPFRVQERTDGRYGVVFINPQWRERELSHLHL